jgi:tetratricopeptide (TPR) repeat protein
MPGSLHPLSGTKSYRADATRDGVPRRLATGMEARESAWIAVTNLLEHAIVVPSDAPALVRHATELARDVLGKDFVRRRGDREWPRDRWPGDAILLLADDAHEADAFQTALALLTALDRADPELQPVHRGRVLARRARTIARLGRLDDARDHFRAVGRLGREAGSVELRARALLGLGSIAQMRGNYPALESLNRRSLRLARSGGFGYIERYSRLGLMVAAIMRHDFESAVIQGWTVYRASIGQPFEEGEILQTFGQLMLVARCFAEARAAFSAVVALPLPGRIIIPTLGGLAIAAAETDRPETVTWVADQLSALVAVEAPRYILSLALLECSIAMARIGRRASSDALRAQATAIAEEHGFHEVTVRAAELDRPTPVEPSVFTPRGRAGRIVDEIALLEPGRLPHEVSLTAVPA